MGAQATGLFRSQAVDWKHGKMCRLQARQMVHQDDPTQHWRDFLWWLHRQWHATSADC